MNDMNIGSRIRVFRKKRGLSQQELARKVGVTWEMISRYERGKSSALQKISELARALDISHLSLLGGEDDSSVVRDARAAHITSSFIPLIESISSDSQELLAKVNSVSVGRKIYGNSISRRLFAVKLGEQSKIRINLSSILPKGMLVCTFDVVGLNSNSAVLVESNGIVILESYKKGHAVLARVLQWIVDLQ